MHTYTIEAVDAQGNPVQIKFPAVTQLMAQAWVELCHESNGWKATELFNEEGFIVWSADK
jgi:uncharacterized protein YxeA